MNNIEMDKEIKEFLDSYKVDFPDVEEMETSIEYIMSNVNPIETRALVFQKRARSLIVNCTREMLNFGWLFWGLNGMFVLLGVISLIQWRANPYITVFTLAPLPFIVGIFEILKSKDEGLIELEMTLKYNTQQIFVSRLLVVGVFNLLINLTISFISSMVNPDIIYTRLLMSWTVPFVVVSGLAFLFAMKTKGNVASGIMLAVWFAVCYGMMQVEAVREILLNMNIREMIGILLVGVFLWAFQIMKIKRMEMRGENYET
ncbi:hypothetical protein [Bacillus sp. UNC438CL73TsuS30]|uniref:hypothetical protein n=1 Tax=Bacillus sp. UNC438CL73TsuS30 TaxID=1340434 RepID=UPI000478E2E4|nr:hypothetical protein [Bacillus sp. UNC438CL73TsuS30]